MRCSRTRYIKVVVLCLLTTFILVQLLGSTGLGFGRKSLPLSDDLTHSLGQEDHHHQQHLFKLNAVNLVELPPSLPSSVQNATNLGIATAQKRQDSVDNDKSQDVDDKKPISSLSGERTHGFSNGSSVQQPKSNNAASEPLNISAILAQMEIINEDQRIRNEDLFGPVTNSTLVIVIQVHNRLQYLRHLIVSLSQAKEIDKCLLIFSHDFWEESINQLISSIDFAKTLQIFYPHSIQTHPNQFPGETPNDCPRNAKKDQAQRLKCTNANWPDLYGHYREAKFTQTKHHWWWKANRVFNKLRATRHYNGMVLFLEEDHYVAEDFVTALRLAESIRTEKHPDCDIICIGTYLKSYNYNRDHKTIELTKWVSAKHNMGMAFNRELWIRIHNCRELFCNFDDYNWDWSLEHISNNCIKDGLEVMLFKGPRVFHIGECGVHHKKKSCEAGVVVQKVKDILSRAEGFLYPKDLVVTRTVARKRKLKTPKGNGGWGDLRDRQLCLNMSRIDEEHQETTVIM